MNTKLLILPLMVLAGCSDRPEHPIDQIAVQFTPPPLASTAPPAPTATPDPTAAQRARLAARVEALPDSDCDALVLRFQIIPRDEILEQIGKPKRELLRYVRRIASEDDLRMVERALNERREWPKQ